MKRETVMIIDGYNVIYRVPRLHKLMDTSLEKARGALLRYCAEWITMRNDVWQFCVVFDGDSSVADSYGQTARGVRAIYSRTKEAADDRILSLIAERGKTARYVVVTDDNRVLAGAVERNAATMSSIQFASVLGRQRRETRGDTAGHDKELSPREEKDINEGLKRAWGIE